MLLWLAKPLRTPQPDWLWLLLAVLKVFILISALVGGLLTVANHHEHVSCLRFSEETGRPTKAVGVMSVKCYVLTETGYWLPASNYKELIN